MRKIRKHNKKNMVLVRKIRNLFDTALYLHKWGFVDIIDSQTEDGEVSDYLQFLGMVMPDAVVTLRVGRDPYYIVIEPLSFAVRPYAMRDVNDILHYAVRIKDDFRIGCKVYHKGEIVYVDMDEERIGDVMRCAGCGRPIVGDAYIETSDTNRIFCLECEGSYYEQCESCDEYFEEDYITADNDSTRHICNGCYEDGSDDWFWCEDCETYNVGDSTTVWDYHGNEILVCEGCLDDHYYCCDECGEYHHVDNGESVDGYGWVCTDCLDDHFTQCYHCGEWFRDRDLSDYGMFDNNDDFICNDCRENGYGEFDEGEDDDREGIRSYHSGRGNQWSSDVGDYGMELLLVETREVNPMLGVELEIDLGGYNHNNARTIRDLIGWNYVICSSDGSLRNGFELVSCPADLPNHMETINWLAGMEKAVELGYKSHNAGTCGLHTHIDRGFFEEEDKDDVDAKFVVVFRNNLWWMRKFSRRDDRGGSWGYCAPNGRNYLNEEDKLGKDVVKSNAFLKKIKGNGGHGIALNFEHGNTVEIRFYRGTLKYNSFLAALQCSDIWARLVKGISIEDSADISLNDFIRVATERNYTNFLTYLAERDISLANEPQRKLVRFTTDDTYHWININDFDNDY